MGLTPSVMVALFAGVLLAAAAPRVTAFLPVVSGSRVSVSSRKRVEVESSTDGGAAVGRKMIDSHLHVWSDGEAPFPWDADNHPPAHLQAEATAEKLLGEMDHAMVGGALIVQPINHKYDHSYVKSVIEKYPSKFKGMCLANPTLGVGAAQEQLVSLKADGFVGVRFNPYLWPEGETMSNRVGCAMYEKAGKLKMPVGFMCFKGFDKHADEIEHLVTTYPKTKCIIDHMGFFWQKGPKQAEARVNAVAWEKLIAMAQYDNVYVKASALFRNSEFTFPHQDAQRRMRELIDVFGSDHVLFGSDFPFVMEHETYDDCAMLMYKMNMPLTVEQLDNLVFGTVEGLFGKWGEAGPGKEDAGADEEL